MNRLLSLLVIVFLVCPVGRILAADGEDVAALKALLKQQDGGDFLDEQLKVANEEIKKLQNRPRAHGARRPS